MKSYLILLMAFGFTKNLITEQEKAEIVRGDLFQVKYEKGTKEIKLQLSGYKLADIDWDKVEVRVYSLKNQVKAFQKFENENPEFKIDSTLLPNQANTLNFNIEYQGKQEVLTIPLK